MTVNKELIRILTGTFGVVIKSANSDVNMLVGDHVAVTHAGAIYRSVS